MRLVLWANGRRGARCLEALAAAGRRPTLLLTHEATEASCGPWLSELARADGIPLLEAPDPNDPRIVERVRQERPDVMVLAGYGRILGREVLSVPRQMTINLHAGRLPQYRGCSPMNWALIRGENSLTLSIIRVDAGIDTGDLLAERTFAIRPDDTIVDLHRRAEQHFPQMLLETLTAIESGTLAPRPQNEALARYFPRRFPDDGLVLWDQLTARQVHNRVRALRPPYPGAFTFLARRRVNLLATRLNNRPHFGEPGRVYQVGERGVLACAADCCLWITQAVFADDGSALADGIRRYDRLATVAEAALRYYAGERAGPSDVKGGAGEVRSGGAAGAASWGRQPVEAAR